MKKWLVNSGLSILFSISVILVMFCLTLLNDNFVIKSLESIDYYDQVYKDLNVYLKSNYQEYECSIDKEVLIKDIDKYVKKDFKISNINNGITCVREVNTDSVYKSFIEFKVLSKIDMKMLYYSVFIIAIIVVIIIGSIFIKTKGIHDIFMIFIISFIPLILTYGLSYLFVDFNNDVINSLFNIANHYLLGVSIILFEIGLFKKIGSRLKS